MSDFHKLGGINRMNQLSETERKELSKKGVQERLNPTIPKATHSGILQIGDKQIECAVIKDAKGNITRVLSSKSIMKVMGRKGGSNSELRKKSRWTGLPVFLLANNLKPFIPLEDPRVTTPIIYKNKGGHKTVGYDYSILTIACEAYLQAKDANVLTPEQHDLAKSCELLMRSFAQVGLVSLIDEVSGYEEVRDRFALQSLLDQHLRKEFAEWAKRFPDEFYKQIFRLNNWKFADVVSKKPAIVGKFTNDIVYSRLLPELVDELEIRNPKNEHGYREAKHHQLMNDLGNTDLNAHIRGVIAIMKATSNWKEFKELLDKIYPIKSAKDILIS
jgi:P63C domain-containing protein